MILDALISGAALGVKIGATFAISVLIICVFSAIISWFDELH